MIAITVVIPVYNVENYLDKCMGSVLKQTFNDYEIILVDDGSTDESGKLCDKYAQQYSFVSVIHQENKGLGGARNTGIKAAKGEYILFLDSDDYINAELLEICYGKAKQYNCDMVLFDSIATYCDGTMGVKYTCPLQPGVALSSEDIKPLVFFSGAWNRLYKKELFVEHEVTFPNHVWYEDLCTIPKLIPFVQIAYYYNEQPLHYYLQRTGSIMHTPNFNRIEKERVAAVKKIQDYYFDFGLSQTYENELQFLWLYHGFFLPLREMLYTGKNFVAHANRLHENLIKYCTTPMQNIYFYTLSKKEQILFKLLWKRKYILIKGVSAANKLLKKVRNVK